MAENVDRILHFNEYFKVIRNRLWVIFTIFTLTILTGWYVTDQVLVKQYTADAQIQIQPRGEISVSTPDSLQTDRPFDPTAFQAEFTIMQSSDVLLPVIEELNLDHIWAKRVYKSPLDKLSSQDALGYMNAVLHLDYKRGTNIVEISATSEVPAEAAAIANAVAEQYKKMRDDKEKERSDRGIGSLRDQVTQQQAVVDEKKAAMEKLQDEAARQGFPIVNDGLAMKSGIDEDLESRKKDLLMAREDYDARQVLLTSVINLPDDQFIDTLNGLGKALPEIGELRGDAFRMESDLESLKKDGFEDNHPRVLALQAELDRKRKQITDLIAGLRRAMTVDTTMAKSRVELLQQEVDDLTVKSQAEQESALVPFREAQREYEQQQSVLAALKVRITGNTTDYAALESPVRVISKAEVPLYPSKPNKTLNMFISMLAGLFVGIVVAFLIEYLDTSVKTMADAEMLLGLPVLTVIPNKGGPMPLVHDSGRLPHAEGYRILRAKLDLKVQNGIGPSLSMLSGGPGEGKSTTIYNLAIVCAQAGQSVILVDGDLRRPTLHNLLNLPNDRGLTNYLQGEGDAVEYIQATPLARLHVLTAGEMPMSEIGVLAGDKIRHMLDDLKQRYDLVLIDSPPVLGISDGSIIAREVDYVILVIQHRRYPREISLRAKRAIEEVHGNCVGMVLNCVAVKSDDSYYYYSNYGEYYKGVDRKKKKKKKKDGATTNGTHAGAAIRQPELDSEEF